MKYHKFITKNQNLHSLIQEQFDLYLLSHRDLNDDDHQIQDQDFLTFFQYLIERQVH